MFVSWTRKSAVWSSRLNRRRRLQGFVLRSGVGRGRGSSRAQLSVSSGRPSRLHVGLTSPASWVIVLTATVIIPQPRVSWWFPSMNHCLTVTEDVYSPSVSDTDSVIPHPCLSVGLRWQWFGPASSPLMHVIRPDQGERLENFKMMILALTSAAPATANTFLERK